MVALLHHFLGILGTVEEQKTGGDGSIVSPGVTFLSF